MNPEIPITPSTPPSPVSQEVPEKVRRDGQMWQSQPLKFLSSFGLASALFVLMALVTLLGTLDQVDRGLFLAQKKYFESWGFLEDIPLGGNLSIPLPLPGGMLLMSLLFVNLALGALWRVKKRPSGIGMFIAHSGILFLLVSGLVTHLFASEGNMALYEGESSNKIQSFFHWQLEVLPLDEQNKATKAVVVPWELLNQSKPDTPQTITTPELPFKMVLKDFALNSVPLPVGIPMAAQVKTPPVDGYVLLSQEPNVDGERNLAGLYVDFISNQAGTDGKGTTASTILWAGQTAPYTLTIDGKKYAIDFLRENWKVPFTIRLDDFTKEDHPGVSTPREFSSKVTKVENGEDQSINIRMNEPLRHKGYTFFQASWGPPDARPGDRLYSMFQVVKNPADHWPLYSLIVSSIGLGIHFLTKLFRFLNRSSRPA